MNTPEATIQTPEQSSVKTPEQILAIENIERYRQQQVETLAGKVDFLKGAEARQAERQDFLFNDLPNMHRNYLASAGIDETHPEYPHYVGILNDFSIETANPLGDRWNIQDPNTHKTMRDEYTERYEQVFGNQNTLPTTPDEQLTIQTVERDPALVLAEEKLNGLRDNLAIQSAKRQGKFFGRGKKYEEAKAAYDEQALKVAKFKMGEIGADNMNDAEKNVAAIAIYFDEQNEMRRAAKDRFDKTKASTFVNWMTSGNRWTRIGKGVALGAAGTIVGAGAGMLIGAAAGVGLAAGAAVAAKSVVSFARGYANNEKKDTGIAPGIGELSDEHKEKAKLQVERSVLMGTDREVATKRYFGHRLEEDILDQQEKRRRSGRAGLLGVAAGIVLGGTLSHVAGELIHGPADWKLGEWSNRSINTPTHAITVPPQEGSFNAGSPLDHQPVPPAPLKSSDTPGMAEAIRNALDGGGGSHGVADTAGDFTGSLGTTELTSTGLDHFNQFIDGHVVQPGESIWQLSQQYLEQNGVKNPSTYQIDAVKDRVLEELQQRGVVGANGWLTAGQRISLK